MKFLNQTKNKIKILHIITSLSGGGAQQVLFRLISNSLLKNDQFEHEVLNLSKGGFYEEKLNKIGIKVFNVGIPRGKFSLKYILKIIKFLRKNNSDLVQTWMYHADFLGGILSKLFTQKKILWNIRSANLTWSLNKWHTVIIAKISSLFSYFIPSAIVSNSNKAISYHINYGYSKKKFELIFNGFDKNLIKPNLEIRKKLRDKFNIKNDEIVIGNIARWDVQKGHENLLEAFSKLDRQKKIKLFLIGENINYQNQDLINLIDKYKLRKSDIILQGQTSQIYDFLNIFDLSVISSVGESFPNAIPECMLMELPIVTTKVGDIVDIINDKNGWSCNPNNSDELSAKITLASDEFCNNKIKWNWRKKNCREKIINFFDIEEMASSYNSLWKRAINDQKFSNIDKFNNYKFENDKQMTVCHIISSMSHGGAQQVLARILRTDKNVNHEIISLSNLGRYGQEIANEGYNILSLDMKRYTINLWKLFQLYKILKYRKYNIIQTWMYHADLIGGILGYILQKKVYWNIRNSDLDTRWSSYLTIFIQNICSILSKKIPHKILSCSDRASTIHMKIGYDNSKFSVIDNGYNLSEIKFDKDLRISFRKKYDIDENEFIFGMVARWDPQKDFESLVESIHLFFKNNNNSKVRFFLAGPNILYNNIDLLNLINSVHLKEKIVLLGNINNVENFMNGIDCHVLSSAGNEGFPNVIGEAMACELPCICTDVGDISKLIYDKNWIVPVKSPNTFAAKMEEIYKLSLSDKETFNKIKKKNREHISNNFEIKKMISSYYSSWSEK
jgi:glycosyltransferase involved in cell wall biosynthesis